MQTMATQLGGQATSADKHEYGFAKVRAHNHSSLLNDIVDEVNTKGHGLLDVFSGNHKYQQQNALRCVFLA
jgi:GMP synthase (glutamine-hydrolysing)